MRENLTELVFILDRSGSMSGLESDTIGGFNSMITKQQKEEGEAIVSTVLFDDVTDVIHDRVPIGDVKKLTEDDYFVRGCTALLDAVGGAIHHIGNVHKYAREEVTNPTRVVTSIVKVEGGNLAAVSVKTKDVIPKGKIFETLEEIKPVVVKAPVKIGDVIVPNVAGTGVDIVATKNIAAV